MSAQIRGLLTQALEHAIAYRDDVAGNSAPPRVDYASLRDRLIGPAPAQASEAEAVLEELVAIAEDGLMPIVGPRFFGWVMGASHPAGVAADWLVSAWGQNAGYHTPTPAMAAIEEIAERWLVEILELPFGSSVGFTTGATMANCICLAAARTGMLLKHGWDPDADGLFGAPPVEVLIGSDAHSSLFSSLQLIGFGYNRVTRIATDEQGRMLPESLAAEIGKTKGPKIIVAQAGQINTGSYDPFEPIVAIGKAHGAWVHVDGAFGLWARAAPGRSALAAGFEDADSWATDGINGCKPRTTAATPSCAIPRPTDPP